MPLKPAFRNGKPLFVGGKPAFSDAACGCCEASCPTCSEQASIACPSCAVGFGPDVYAPCTPRYVLAVFSGITYPSCVGTVGGLPRSSTITPNPFGGSFLVEVFSTNCFWRLVQSPGTEFDIRTWNNRTCTGAPAGSNQPITVEIDIGNQTAFGRGYVVRASLAGGAVNYLFAGQASLTTCGDTYVLSNGTMYNNVAPSTDPVGTVGVGGTCTLTFCP